MEPNTGTRYVTDGHHTYIWNDEYEPLLADGRLKDCPAPPPKELKALTPREQTKLDQMRKKALAEAQDAVKVLSQSKADLTGLFGSEPKEE